MYEQLLQLDYALFDFINDDLKNIFFDAVLPWWRDKITWIPLYILMLFLILKTQGKKGIWIILMVAMAVVLANFISSDLIKPYFNRLRPCKNPAFADQINILVNCGSGRSFVSSHATNHFTLAMSWGIPLYQRLKWLLPVSMIWAASIAFGQVYVGVHYPFDIIGGTILGLSIGTFFGLLAKRLMNQYPMIKKS